MKRAVAWAAVTLASPLLWAQPGSAQPSEELKALRQDVRRLKEGETAIQKDLQEIKRLLQARPAGQAAPRQEAVLNLDGAPVKGAKATRVTLVEFTDYQ